MPGQIRNSDRNLSKSFGLPLESKNLDFLDIVGIQGDFQGSFYKTPTSDTRVLVLAGHQAPRTIRSNRSFKFSWDLIPQQLSYLITKCNKI